MKYNTLFLFAVTLFLWSSCSSPCPPDVTLGEFPLSDISKEFIPYNGIDTLIFEDQDSRKHKLYSENELLSEETNTILRTICSDGLTQGQQELYKTERIDVAYNESDSDTTQIQIFSLNLSTSSEIADSSDAHAVFDLLNISSNGFERLKILTDERQNQVSENYKIRFLKLSEFLGDTTLFEKEFKDVYEQKSENGRMLYFNKSKGVLALKYSETEYLVLKE